MKLSGHAKSKLEIYGIEAEKVIEICENSSVRFFDAIEDSEIIIAEIETLLFVAVVNLTTQTVITVYRTDLKTIENRKKTKRWI